MPQIDMLSTEEFLEYQSITLNYIKECRKNAQSQVVYPVTWASSSRGVETSSAPSTPSPVSFLHGPFCTPAAPAQQPYYHNI